MEATKQETEGEATTLAEHQQVVAAFVVRLAGIREEVVIDPTMATVTYLGNGWVLYRLTEEDLEALANFGMARELRGAIEAALHGLRSAEALLQAERVEGWSLTIEKHRRAADMLRAEVYAAAVLALRRHPDGHQWSNRLRWGMSLLSLQTDLVFLAQLLWDNRIWFEGIRLDVDAVTKQLSEMGHELCEAIVHQQIARKLTGSKNVRDRMLTLLLDAMEEVAAFAVYATRGAPARAAVWAAACRGVGLAWPEPLSAAGVGPGARRRAA